MLGRFPARSTSIRIGKHLQGRWLSVESKPWWERLVGPTGASLVRRLQEIGMDAKRSRASLVDPRPAPLGDDAPAWMSADASRLARRVRRGTPEGENTRGTLWQALAVNAFSTSLKAAVWLKTGSSAMFAETIHSLVDTANQATLNRGQSESLNVPDKEFQFGYGKSQYVWGLMSAMGILWMGAGLTIYRGVEALIFPPEAAMHVPWEAWFALTTSFGLDAYVLWGAIKELARRTARDDPDLFRPVEDIAVSRGLEVGPLALLRVGPGVLIRRGVAVVNHVRWTKDTSVAAVVMEDAAGCAGVIFAIGGVVLTSVTGNPMWDALASLSIGGMLGVIAIKLVQRNRKLLLGAAVDPEIMDAIVAIISNRPAIDGVQGVQSQWISPDAFAIRASVNLRGAILADRLEPHYQSRFASSAPPVLSHLLQHYAEDVTRAVERELRDIEADIRKQFPEAAFIELEPDSSDSHTLSVASYDNSPVRDVV
jgi:solute carrier family 30 (zinc transporter), member 9